MATAAETPAAPRASQDGSDTSGDKPRRKPRIGRRLLGLLVPHAALVAGALALGIVSVGLSLLGPKLLGDATDRIIAGAIGQRLPSRLTQEIVLQHLRETDRENLALIVENLNVIPGQGINIAALNQLLLITLGLYIVNALTLSWHGRLTVAVVQRVVFGLRDRLEQKLDRLPMSTFDTMAKGEVLSRMTNDIDNIQRTLQQTVSGVITSLLSVIGVLAVMFFISPLLLIIVLLSLPLAGATTTWLGRRAQARFAEQWAATGSLTSYVEEIYTGHSLVKGFGQRDVAEQTFDERNEAMYAAAAKAQFLAGSIAPAAWFASNLNYVSVAVVGALRISTGAISVGDVQAFTQYTGLLSHSLAEVANLAGMLQSGLASADRVFELLDAEEEKPDPKSPARLDRVRGRVQFDRVSFSYTPGKPLIDGLSLAIEPGQTLAIVGESGSGKTTVGSLLMRFYEVNGGRILLDGTDTATMTRHDLRRHTGLVPQDTWTFKGTIAENIAYGRPDATREEIVAAAHATCVDRFVRTLPDGYDTEIDPDSSTISAGELQLITVARVFLSQPRILVMDEATSSVDTRTEMLIRRAMRSLTAGRTSLIIAHRISTIRDADLIVVMDSGAIVERGTHDELLARNGRYARLYTLGTPPPDPAFERLPQALAGAPARHAAPDQRGSGADLGSTIPPVNMAPGTFYPPARSPSTALSADAPDAVLEVISGLRGSITHHLSVAAYQRHNDAGTGTCIWCGRPAPCLTRQHAAAVIMAAGDDPQIYEIPDVGMQPDSPTLPLPRPSEEDRS